MSVIGKLPIVLLACQVTMAVLFWLLVRYDPAADALHDVSAARNQSAFLLGRGLPRLGGTEQISQYYPMFQDVQVMIFVGFGFLMTFLKRYAFFSVSFTLLISALCIQWSILMRGFLDIHDGYIEINVTSLLLSDFTCSAVLISFGVLLGKLSPLQYVLLAACEVPVFLVNEWLGVKYCQAVDLGGSMYVHAFGAFFGVACSGVLYSPQLEQQAHLQTSSYDHDVFSMIGTVFLWLYWPSFNAVLAPGDDQIRAVINTYLALSGSCVVTFAASTAVTKKGKIAMEHVQNASLAGGVAVGTTADMLLQPWGALAAGGLAGLVSVLGFRFGPGLMSRIHLHDTCGAFYLHGIPGIMASLLGVLLAAQASESNYGPSLYQIFPARAPVENSTALLALRRELHVVPGQGRTASGQALSQLAALGLTILIASVGGVVTGLVLKLPFWDQPEEGATFDDETWFILPSSSEQAPEEQEGRREQEPKKHGTMTGYDNNGFEIEFTRV